MKPMEQKSVGKGNLNAARNQLSALTNELRAQPGKHISARAAQLLLGDVNFVIANL